MTIWYVIAIAIFAVIFGIAGILIGRKNADKADTLNDGVTKASGSFWTWFKGLFKK